MAVRGVSRKLTPAVSVTHNLKTLLSMIRSPAPPAPGRRWKLNAVALVVAFQSRRRPVVDPHA
jgi:hypothetical protein